MPLSQLQVAFVSGSFSLLGVLVGALITYAFALRLGNRNARRDAGRRLREAFRPELALMDAVTDSKSIDVEHLLREAWPKHHAAVSELMFNLSAHKRAELEAVWREYYEVGGSIRFFDYHFGDHPLEKFRERVGAILKFTEV